MNDGNRPMTVVEAIHARRSVRAFTGRKIGRLAVAELLAAAVRAPTAVHEELWAFVVVQDPGLLKRLSDKAKPLFATQAHLDHGGHGLEAFAREDFNIFYDAGTLIVICGPSTAPFAAADCWLAAENLMLAASAQGYGTCVIGSAVAALNLPELKAELGIPAGYTAVAPVIVGEPATIPPLTSRKEPRVLAWK